MATQCSGIRVALFLGRAQLVGMGFFPASRPFAVEFAEACRKPAPGHGQTTRLRLQTMGALWGGGEPKRLTMATISYDACSMEQVEAVRTEMKSGAIG